MKTLKTLTQILTLTTLPAMATDYSDSSLNAEFTLKASDQRVDNGVSGTVFGAKRVHNPVYFVFKVDDEGNASIQEAGFYTGALQTKLEEYGDIEVDLQILGGYYRQIHKEIGKTAGVSIASVDLSKAYQISDQMVFILTGTAQINNGWSLRYDGSTESMLPEQPEGQGKRDGKAYNEDTVNLNLETTGKLRFYYGKGHFEATASYKHYGQKEYKVYKSNERIFLDESEAKLELSYTPHSHKGSKFSIGIKQKNLNRNMIGNKDSFTDTQVYFNYEYTMDWGYGLKDRYSPKQYDAVEEYVEDEELGPEIY